MNVTLTSLEALILKATHESLPCPDAAALEAFCAVMKDSAEGPQLAVQALAARIHTTNSQEAMLTLSLIDRCMRRGDTSFHAEVGKFRFLNEMIKLVSPKYLADRTAPEVRTRVLQLLHAWSLEYPKETKFKVAYEMLKFQGVVKETPPPLPPEEGGPPSKIKTRNAIFEDEEKTKLLQKLLQSKKPEDIQQANRLIKSIVREEERRNEVSSRRAQEVAAALDSADLLNDMLEYADNASPEEEQLIQELYNICLKMRPVLQDLASDDTTFDKLNDILKAIDLLDEVLLMYEEKVTNKKKKEAAEAESQKAQSLQSESLLDFAGASINKGTPDIPKISSTRNNAIDELGDIFSTGSLNTVNEAQLLKPVNLMPNEDVDLLGGKSKAEGWNELDSLGEELLKQSLPENAKRLENFNCKTKKIPMNALTSPKHESPISNDAMLDLDFFIKKPEEEPKPEPPPPKPTQNDDLMVDLTEPNTSTNILNNNISENILDLSLPTDDAKCKGKSEGTENKKKIDILKKEKGSTGKTVKTVRWDLPKTWEVKPLTDINIDIDKVKPSMVAPITAFNEDGGINIVLHFCKDKPRPDANVIVISTSSKNRSPILDYKFQGVVPKGCKIRLLTPSSTTLSPFNPFLPPPAVTQVMVIARPPSTPVSLKFVITYTLDDDMCSDMGEVKYLPLDDIRT